MASKQELEDRIKKLEEHIKEEFIDNPRVWMEYYMSGISIPPHVPTLRGDVNAILDYLGLETSVKVSSTKVVTKVTKGKK